MVLAQKQPTALTVLVGTALGWEEPGQDGQGLRSLRLSKQPLSLFPAAPELQKPGYSFAQKVFIASPATTHLRAALVYPAPGQSREGGADVREQRSPSLLGLAVLSFIRLFIYSFMPVCSKHCLDSYI